MIQKILENIEKGIEVRKNLSTMREIIKNPEKKKACRKETKDKTDLFESLLESEDAKTRKNTALLIGDLEIAKMKDLLWKAYEKEETLFVRSSYLVAMQNMDLSDYLSSMKARMQKLENMEAEENSQKHIREELQQLTKLLLSAEGVKKHKFIGWQKENEVILLANRRHLDVVLSEIKAHPYILSYDTKLMNAGIRMKTARLDRLMEIRTWQELLFLVPEMKTCEKDPKKAAEVISSSKLIEFLEERHKGTAPFYFRVEVKMQLPEGNKKAESRKEQEQKVLEEKTKFVKKLVNGLEENTGRKLINSTSDYEFEIRLIENKEGRFNIMVKLFTMEDQRFDYRTQVVSASIRPANAALMVQLAKEYMSEGARVLDPFCGVGTMLIERQKKVSADTSYGIDIFAQALEKAKKNTEAAGQVIHYINRDCFTFTHEYLFDEIITNMPFAQGRTTGLEIYEIYEKFFEMAKRLVRTGGVIVFYSHDKAYVEKLLPKTQFECMKKCQINVKEDTWLYVLKNK